MPAPELEQFLDRGQIRAWWGLAWRAVAGLATGAVLGQQLGVILYGNRWPMAALTILGAALGLSLMLQRRGLVNARRLAIRGAYYARRIRKHNVIDGRAHGIVPAEVEQPALRVRLRPSAPDDDDQPPSRQPPVPEPHAVETL